MLKGELPETLDGHTFRPETLATHVGYVPGWSEGAAVPPVFLNSTWIFKNGSEGEKCFAAMRDPDGVDAEKAALAYSRINEPNCAILEKRLAALEGAEAAAVFGTGMGAITTLCMTLLRPGDTVLHSEPLYGGTDHLMKHVLPEFGIITRGFNTVKGAYQQAHTLRHEEGKEAFDMIFVETPANPTMTLFDIELLSLLPSKYTVVDNTFMSPLGQRPLDHGADAVVYSATKSLGGHGDLIGGSVCGSRELVRKLKAGRSCFGSIMSPFVAWLLMQHIGTLHMRIPAMAWNTEQVAQFLAEHPAVHRVHYPGFMKDDDMNRAAYQKQCLNAGHMISFEVRGGKEAAFRVLDKLELIAHAVSLGGIKSLICHPASTTHSGVSAEDRGAFGISDDLIRLSVGTEHADDLIWDLDRALACA